MIGVGGDPLLREVVPGLYEIGDLPAGAVCPSPAIAYAYLLTAASVDGPGSPVTLGDTWMGSAWNGWYLFLTEPIANPEAFVLAARAQLPQPQGPPDWRAFTWLSSTEPIVVLANLGLFAQDETTRTFLGGTTQLFEWGAFGLQMSGAPTVSYVPEDGAFLLNGMNLAFVTLAYGGLPADGFLPYGGSPGMWNILLPAAGAGTGGFRFNVAIDPGKLTRNLRCAFSYFYPAGNAVADLYYTFAPPAPQTTVDGNYLGYVASLHPLLTTDPAWSMLVFDTSGENTYQTNSRNLRFPYFATTTGKPIVLSPMAPASPLPAGWAFCLAPSGGTPEVTTLYLAPAGTFSVESVGDSTTDDDVEPLMCGLSGQEYLEIQPGDLVAFAPGMPAYAEQFTPAGSPSSNNVPAAESPNASMALSSRFTTSWLQFPLASGEAGNVASTRGYFGQPSSSVYFAATDPDFSTPVTSLLVELEQPTVFPIVPYAGAYASQQGTPFVPPFNVGVPPSAFAAFEGAAISSDRHAIATAGTAGPRFIPAGHTARSVRALATPSSSPWTSLTPQGFVVELDAQGNWNRLLVARDPSPGTPPRYIAFDAGTQPAVSRDVANAVLQEQLFLVVSDSANLGAFDNALSLQGFNFTLDVANSGDVQTILVFKFNTTLSLADLVRSPNLWAARDQFVTNLSLTQERLLAALDVAGVLSPPGPRPDDTNDPFASFRALAEDPLWTGIVAFGCPIQGNGMPPDLQMLLGGIDGQLHAHHLAITRNRVTTVGELSTLEESSLSGVILYPLGPAAPEAPPGESLPDLDYAVKTLLVVFANSTITQFNVEVGLTINRLFGRSTLIEGATSPGSPSGNVLLMPGQYQTQGAGSTTVGVVLFGVDPTAFYLPVPPGTTRVLDHIVVDVGSLAPVSSTPLTPAGTHLVARFSLGGHLQFAPSPFPPAPDLDIFSFDALPFSDMTVTMEFDLDENGALVPATRKLTFDPTLLKLTSDKAVIRSHSLMYSLPLRVSGFLAATDAAPLSTSSLGAQAVHSLELEGKSPAPRSPASPSEALETAGPPGDYPFVTATPAYALEFDMPLGSLGALSDVASLTAKLLLGWGPSSLVPDADAAAVFVQLPQLSAGYGSFNLQGILKTTFGDANLLKVPLRDGDVYSVLFNNIKLSLLGFSFPPGVVIDFLLFAGPPDAPGGSSSTNTSNIAWYLSAQKG